MMPLKLAGRRRRTLLGSVAGAQGRFLRNMAFAATTIVETLITTAPTAGEKKPALR